MWWIRWVWCAWVVAASDKPWAVVTGASSGIGTALAERAAECDFNVVLSGRNRAALCRVATRLEELGAATEIVVVDLGKPRGAETLYASARRRVAARGGTIRALAANAGVANNAPVLATSVETLDTMIALNARSCVVLCRLFGHDLAAERCGTIVVTGSVTSVVSHGIAGAACYAATKAFVRSFTHALHSELKRYGVSVVHLAPGAVATDFARAASMERSVVFQFGRHVKSVVMTPRPVARTVTFTHRRHQRRREVIPGVANKMVAVVAKYFPSAIARDMAAFAFATQTPVRHIVPDLEKNKDKKKSV